MPAAIGTERFLLIGVASLLHAKAIGTPLTTTAANAAILDNVKNKLETLPGNLLILMEHSFGINNTVPYSSRKVRIAKLAEHLIQ